MIGHRMHVLFFLSVHLLLCRSSDISAPSFPLFDEFNGGPEFRKHVIESEMSLLHVGFRLIYSDIVQRLFVGLTEIDADFSTFVRMMSISALMPSASFPAARSFSITALAPFR